MDRFLDSTGTAAALAQLGWTDIAPARPVAEPPPPVYAGLPAVAPVGLAPERGYAGTSGFRPEGTSAAAVSGFRPERGAAAVSGFRPERPAGAVSGFTEDPSGLAVSGNNAWFEEQAGQYASIPGFGGATPSPGLGTGGSLGKASGDVAVLNQYDGIFKEAEAKYGVPAALIKAVAAAERGWQGTSPAGAAGLMQIMPGIWGGKAAQLGYGDFASNPYSAIMMGAYILKQNYGYENSWEWAAKRYLGLGGPDAFGTDSSEYWDRVSQYWNLFATGSSNATGGGGSQGGGGWQQAFTTMFGSDAVGDYGFNAPNSLGYYAYGDQYGMDGVGHTGIDQPMPVGTPYRAPMGGTVTCAGTNVGQGAEGAGCGAFNDYFGQGAGRVEVLLDNGAVLIYGHSSTSALRVGDRFAAGQVLGTSGGQNGPHIHLEARVRDPSTKSGWRIVDPRTVLGGGGFSTGGGGFGGLGGAPAPATQGVYTSGSGSFTDFFLRQAAQQQGWG